MGMQGSAQWFPDSLGILLSISIEMSWGIHDLFLYAVSLCGCLTSERILLSRECALAPGRCRAVALEWGGKTGTFGATILPTMGSHHLSLIHI